MSSAKYICGTVEYEKSTYDKDNIEVHATWNIPHFMNLMKNEECLEIETPEVTETSADDWKFQFKIIFVRGTWSCENMYINYLSPTILFIKSVQLKTFTFDVNNWAYDQEKSIVTQKCAIVAANKFKFLMNLLVNDSYIQVDDYICLLRNGSLRLKFEFVITIENKIKEKHFGLPDSKLIVNFENLFNTGMFSDVIMKSSENEEFKVHKAILASRSPVLKAHFEHNTVESTTNIVEAPLESAVLREVLLFIYTDKTPNVDKIAEKLLVAADYYNLSELKSVCEKTLFIKLTVNNAVDILLLADLHSADTLKNLILDFLRLDFQQLKLVTKTEGWTKLKSVDLMRKICE